MFDATTRITINGAAGDRFLSSLGRYRAPMPRALRWLATSPHRTIEVGRDDADLIARFVEDLLAAGWVAVDAPPLLFSPRVGDVVVLSRDVLAEVARARPGSAPRWELVEAGTRGKLIGWRERHGEEPRAVVDVTAPPFGGAAGRAQVPAVDVDGPRRLVVFVRERSVTRGPRWRRG
jgi:hypothetical protein